jgi:hypothetical protein
MKLQHILCVLLAFTALTSCKKSTEDEPAPAVNAIDYNYLTSNTPYNQEGSRLLFVNAKGDSTVDRTEGRVRLRMLKALDAYCKTASGTGTAELDALVLSNMFSNNASPFTGLYTDLNSSTLQIKNVTATSKVGAPAIRAEIESYFTEISDASADVLTAASNGQAGKLGNYLVDEKGIEWGQVISKSLMGAFQLDYIANNLLSNQTLLNANNTKKVEGKPYTVLAHSWDEAYGTLTYKDRYAQDATESSNGGESFLGAYVWEYNKAAYPKLHLAFLKGRAAIVNNDRAEALVQAKYIRKQLENTIANAALGYLGKWKTGTTDAARAHAIGEGMGFIYALRFCNLHGGDATFSDDILDDLIYSSANGFWDLTNDKVNTAIAAIQTKFGN